ncbi:thiaminase II [Pseudovibrio exalbescens]|uniref:Aminopyrimidine aminohydrolase n=1 Tax=Pseudovibrio exalbescens TaxID=197461 RepID=A0A1U7JDX4_9HYPH|nr:thiaminase II [Pseudovibrio exalbescens]OKL42950.1 thiaminase II [Pseudovibrio exalbescens]
MKLFDRLKDAAAGSWRDYTHHEFVEKMAAGTLPHDAFRRYLLQDYLFLIDFSRAYALAIYKSQTLGQMRSNLVGLKGLIEMEMDLHVRICERWGLSAEDLEKTPQRTETLAYTSYVLETGHRGDLLDLKVALAPCVIGYGEIGERLAAIPGALDERNPYAEWIREYSGPDYQELRHHAIAELDDLAPDGIGEGRFRQLTTIFDQATRLETDFWQMGLKR